MGWVGLKGAMWPCVRTDFLGDEHQKHATKLHSSSCLFSWFENIRLSEVRDYRWN